MSLKCLTIIKVVTWLKHEPMPVDAPLDCDQTWAGTISYRLAQFDLIPS